MTPAIRGTGNLARRLILMTLIALGGLAQNAARGDETMPQLLPKNVAGWSAAGEDKVFTRNNIFEYMDGAGEIYLAYDFQRLLVREYMKWSAPRLVAEVYQMASSEDAYGIFSHDRDGQEILLGQGAIYGAGLLRFWKGRFFVRLQAESESEQVKQALLALGKKIVEAVPQNGKKPPLLAALPREGLIKESIHFFHTPVSLNVHYYLADSNVLNLSAKTDVALARYERDKRKMRLLLCRYKTPGEAEAAFEQFNKIYFHDRAAKTPMFRVEKVEKGEFVGAQCMGSSVILVFEAADRASCEWLSKLVAARVKGVSR